MKRVLLTLLASSVSLAATLLVASTAHAAPIASRNIKPAISTPVIQIVNLNLTNLSLNSTNQQSNPFLHQLGCSCAVCARASRQPSL
jgi:hypothetical protein